MTLNEEELVVQMQQKQLEMLHELDRVCKKNNLTYVLFSGTCLGALRLVFSRRNEWIGRQPWNLYRHIRPLSISGREIKSAQNHFGFVYLSRSYRSAWSAKSRAHCQDARKYGSRLVFWKKKK